MSFRHSVMHPLQVSTRGLARACPGGQGVGTDIYDINDIYYVFKGYSPWNSVMFPSLPSNKGSYGPVTSKPGAHRRCAAGRASQLFLRDVRSNPRKGGSGADPHVEMDSISRGQGAGDRGRGARSGEASGIAFTARSPQRLSHGLGRLVRLGCRASRRASSTRAAGGWAL